MKIVWAALRRVDVSWKTKLEFGSEIRKRGAWMHLADCGPLLENREKWGTLIVFAADDSTKDAILPVEMWATRPGLRST